MTMRKTNCLLLSVLMAGAAWGADAFDATVPHISWEDAADHYGERCVVYGTVVAAKDIGSRCFLNFHADFRNNFTVVVNQEHYGAFSERPDILFLGEHVRVVGDVIEFKGKPEIIVTDAASIEVVESPQPPAPTAQAPVEATSKSAPAPVKPAAAPAAVNEPAPPALKVMPRKPPATGTIKLATYNLYNLFDDFDDPYVEHERLPGKSVEEIALLAKAIRAVDADVLALQEVENRPFVESFVREHLAGMGYAEVVFFEGNSDRGIDVALLSRYPVGPVTLHRHLEFPDGNGRPMRFQRDLLQVSIEPEERQAFEVFVVHLKSKYGGPEKALPIRMGEATTIRRIFDEKLRRDPAAAFVICGDFNDTFDSKPLQTIVGSGSTALRSFVDQLPADQAITYNKDPYRSTIDFILASPAMAKAYRDGSYGVLAGTVASSGSDHNPVFAEFQLPPKR